MKRRRSGLRRSVRRLAGLSPALLPACFAGALLASGAARAEDLESDAVYVSAQGARSLLIRNPLGTVRVHGWDRPDVRIIAHKRAGSASLLQRLRVRVDWGEGRLRVATGFYLSDNTFNVLPLGGAGIDLVIDAPRAVQLAAATFRGDIDADGFRSGAQLSSQEGHLRVADIEGRVDTHAFDGNQWIEDVHGSLAASGVLGDMDLVDIQGQQVDASVMRGRITARHVEARVVNLHTAAGTIVFVGRLVPDGAYHLASRDGDVRLLLREAPFRLIARAHVLRSDIPLDGAGQPQVWNHVALGRPTRPATLDLASAHGRIDLAATYE